MLYPKQSAHFGVLTASKKDDNVDDSLDATTTRDGFSASEGKHWVGYNLEDIEPLDALLVPSEEQYKTDLGIDDP